MCGYGHGHVGYPHARVPDLQLPIAANSRIASRYASDVACGSGPAQAVAPVPARSGSRQVTPAIGRPTGR